MRTPIEQYFLQYALAVGTVPTPVNGNLDLSSLITSFVISNASANLNSVFLGGSNVTIQTGNNVGIEIKTGDAPSFAINQARQLYELQFPLLRSTEALICAPQQPDDQPVFVFNMTNWFLIATAATTVSVMLFKEPFI